MRRQRKKRVLIVDDSKTVQRILSDIINDSADFEVLDVASDPFEAKRVIVREKPDVITLDVQMPKMNGLDFLEKLMKTLPIPVIMVSALTKKNSEISLKALSLGAVDVLAKPVNGRLLDIADELIRKLHVAVAVSPGWLERFKNPTLFGRARGVASTSNKTTEAVQRQKLSSMETRSQEVTRRTPMPKTETGATGLPSLIAIGASTGGTVAIEYILKRLDASVMPPIVIVQHIPPVFSRSFAERLNSLFPRFTIFEASIKQELTAGDVAIAQGDTHLVVEKTRTGVAVALKDGPPVHHQRPSIDILFNSVAAALPGRAIGILLTGMGKDGARGLLNMRLTKSHTIAQTNETCAVAGMPQAAREINAVDSSFSLDEMVTFLNTCFGGIV